MKTFLLEVNVDEIQDNIAKDIVVRGYEAYGKTGPHDTVRIIHQVIKTHTFYDGDVNPPFAYRIAVHPDVEKLLDKPFQHITEQLNKEREINSELHEWFRKADESFWVRFKYLIKGKM